MSSLLPRWISKLFRGKRPSPVRKQNGFRPSVELLEAREVPAAMSIGMNTENVFDFSPAWIFKDAFKQSRPWLPFVYNTVTHSLAIDYTNHPSLDSRGWPMQLNQWSNDQGQLVQQLLGTFMFDGLNGHYAGGTYHAEWQGTGTIQWGGDALVTEQGTTAAGAHYALLNVTPANYGIFMRIATMSSTDPIHDVHVWMPDYNGQSFVGQVWHPGADFSPFHPLYVDRLRGFDTIRFMQMQETNTSDIVHWSDRRSWDYATQQTTSNLIGGLQNGMAPEYMIELANEVHANAWFNMPFMADDDFVRNFATEVHTSLDPTLKAYVEWGNEIWNAAPGFEGYYWVQQQTTLPENAGLNFFDIWARESRRDFDIWSDIYAGQSDRLVRTAAGFQAIPWVTNEFVRRLDGHFDTISVGAYIGPTPPQRAAYTTSTTVDQVIDDTLADIPLVMSQIDQHEGLAEQYSAALGRHIPLVIYEGGVDTDRPQGFLQVLYDAQQSQRMYDVFGQLLTGLNNEGVELFVDFLFASRSPFGALHDMTTPLADAPKLRAMVDAINGSLLPSLSIEATSPNAAEMGVLPATFTVTRSNADLSQPVTVPYAVTGSATAGSDYAALTGSVLIPAGAASATITLTPIDDSLVESPETVTLTLFDVPRYDLGPSASATATIASDDVSTVSVQATDAAGAEAGSDPAVFTVTRDNPNIEEALTVTYSLTGSALNGSDYAALAGNVVIPAGQTSVTVTIAPIDDPLVEGLETVTLTLLGSNDYHVGTAASAAATIADNDVLIGTGLRGHYFDNKDLTSLKLTRTDAAVNFSWGAGSPATTIAPDTFSIRWSGQVRAVESGTYTFRTVSDDGIRLWINGNLIINNWTDHSSTPNTSGPVVLAAGQQVSIKLEYYENKGTAAVQLLWKRPGQASYTVIPQEQLFAATSSSPAVTYQAETAALSGASIGRSYAGYTGTGYVSFGSTAGSSSEWTVTVPADGIYSVKFRYANGSTADRRLSLAVNGATVNAALAFPKTGGWSIWKDGELLLPLAAGSNTIRLTMTDTAGPIIDSLTVA